MTLLVIVVEEEGVTAGAVKNETKLARRKIPVALKLLL
jgi:hypothetical protein